jgi:hypothetical protein
MVSLETTHVLQAPTRPGHLALASRIDGVARADIGGKQPHQNRTTRVVDQSRQRWPHLSHLTPQAQESCWL